MLRAAELEGCTRGLTGEEKWQSSFWKSGLAWGLVSRASLATLRCSSRSSSQRGMYRR